MFYKKLDFTYILYTGSIFCTPDGRVGTSSSGYVKNKIKGLENLQEIKKFKRLP